MQTSVPCYLQELFTCFPGSANSSLVVSRCLSASPSLSVQATYNSSNFPALIFSFKIVDIKSFGVFLLPLVGIDLYALCADLKKMQIWVIPKYPSDFSMWCASQHHFFSRMTAKSPLSHSAVGFLFAAECPSVTHYSRHLGSLKCLCVAKFSNTNVPVCGMSYFSIPNAPSYSAFDTCPRSDGGIDLTALYLLVNRTLCIL